MINIFDMLDILSIHMDQVVPIFVESILIWYQFPKFNFIWYFIIVIPSCTLYKISDSLSLTKYLYNYLDHC